MSNSPLPVSEVVLADSAKTTVKYKVLSQDGRRVTLENNPCSPLIVGQSLLFAEGLSGVIIEADLAVAVAFLGREGRSTNSATKTDWLTYNDPSTAYLLVDLALIGDLDVKCTGTNTQEAGFVGWSLYDTNDSLVALGNDLFRHNTCYFKGKGVWQVGEYKLEVRSFLPFTFQPLGYALKTWQVSTPTQKLSAGSFDDYTEKLLLS